MLRTSFAVYLHSLVWLNVKELLARSRRYIGSLTSEVWDPVAVEVKLVRIYIKILRQKINKKVHLSSKYDLSSEISSIGQMLRQCLIWSTGFAEHSETDD